MDGAERPLDADGADVRKERIARCRAGLDRRAAEAPIEIEQRRVLRGAGTWRRPCALPAVARAPARASARHRRRTLPVRPARVRDAADCARPPRHSARRRASAAVPVHQRRTARCRAGTRSARSGTDPKPIGVTLSPKIGVIVIVYSPSDGNRCSNEQAAACAERQPFDVIVLRRVLAGAIDDQRRLSGSPSASLLIFCAAVTYASTSVDEMPSAPAMLSKPEVESSDGRYFAGSIGRSSRSRTEFAHSVLIETMQAGWRCVWCRAGDRARSEPRAHRLVGRRIRAPHVRRAASSPPAASAPTSSHAFASRWTFGGVERVEGRASSPSRRPAAFARSL